MGVGSIADESRRLTECPELASEEAEMQVRLGVTRAMTADASGSSSIRHRRLQRILVPLLLLAGSLGGVLVAASPASATVTITHPFGFPVPNNGDTEGSSSASTSVPMPAAYGSIGDLAVLLGHYDSASTTITRSEENT